jgi:hypothetical protein
LNDNGTARSENFSAGWQSRDIFVLLVPEVWPRDTAIMHPTEIWHWSGDRRALCSDSPGHNSQLFLDDKTLYDQTRLYWHDAALFHQCSSWRSDLSFIRRKVALHTSPTGRWYISLSWGLLYRGFNLLTKDWYGLELKRNRLFSLNILQCYAFHSNINV